MQHRHGERSLQMTAVLVALLSIWGCATTTEAPGVESGSTGMPGVTLPISYNEAMVAAVDHSAHELWNAVGDEDMPQTDEDWTELEHHAWQLVVASTAIQLPGTGVADATWSESPDWRRLANDMSDAAMSAAEAARDHDIAALSTAGDRLVDICTECHMLFKPEVPSEGIFHPHYR